MSELDDLLAAQQKILEQAAEINKKIEEAKKKAELEKPLVIQVIDWNVHSVFSKADYRSDYLELKQKILGWHYDNYNARDVIPIKFYDIWKEELLKLPNVNFKISKHHEQAIEYQLRGPDVHIMLSEKGFKIKLKPGILSSDTFGYEMSSIAILNNNDNHYYIPLNEGGRLLLKLKDKGTWDEDARKAAEEDLEKRDKLNTIALSSYSEYGDVDLNGNKLMPFQTVSVEFGRDTNWKFITADEMGLGKTWQAIAQAVKAESKKIAVIVPASVKINWQREIKRLTGDDVYFCDGTQPSKVDLAIMGLGQYKWYLFNYDMLARPIKDKRDMESHITVRERYLWAEAINLTGFDHLILDEAHRCKNLDAGRTKAVRQIKLPRLSALTGTPILNRPHEMWPILNMIDPKAFPSYEGFISRYTNGKYGVKNVQELRELLAKYMIRRTKKDVMKDLPPVTRTTRFVELTAQQWEQYKTILDMIMIDLETGEEIGEINSILVKILRLKQFLSAAKSSTVADFAREIVDESEEDDKHKKVIIFSQFVDEVRKVGKLLGGESLTIIGSDDKPEDRQKIVDQFQTDDRINFLVCSTTAANEGLNITAAGHVIFLDFMWTPAAHQQAEGRAYGRLNDPHPIDAYYFAVSNTLDDWLQDVLLRKLSTYDAVIEGVNVTRMEEDSIIKEMFKYLRSQRRK